MNDFNLDQLSVIVSQSAPVPPLRLSVDHRRSLAARPKSSCSVPGKAEEEQPPATKVRIGRHCQDFIEWHGKLLRTRLVPSALPAYRFDS